MLGLIVIVFALALLIVSFTQYRKGNQKKAFTYTAIIGILLLVTGIVLLILLGTDRISFPLN